MMQIAALAVVTGASAQDWSRFRGPNGSGVASDSGYAVEFSKTRNLIWRTPVRAGKSSPVLTRNHIFLTSFENDQLFTHCFERSTGRLLWERAERRVWKEDVNRSNNPAAITPTTDGENVYVFFKDFGLISYDASGNLRWKTPLGPFYNSMGISTSPILAGDSVVLVLDQLSGSYIIAVDSKTGEVRWRVEREEQDGWSTPILFDAKSFSEPLIVTTSSRQLGGYRVSDGHRMFTHVGLPAGIIASPVLYNNAVFMFGYSLAEPPWSQKLSEFDKDDNQRLSADEYAKSSVLTAVANYLGNRDGIVSEDEWKNWSAYAAGGTHLAMVELAGASEAPASETLKPREIWKHERGYTSVIPSPIAYEGILYVIKNGGILTAFDIANGEILKMGRVTGAVGGFSASPIAAAGKIFLANEDGKVAVIRAGKDWEVQAVNELDEAIFATPALSDGRIFLRTSEALYAFGASTE